MKLNLDFANLRFPGSILRQAISTMEKLPSAKGPGRYSSLTATLGAEQWEFNHAEEFFAGLPDAHRAALYFRVPLKSADLMCSMSYYLDQSGASVSIESERRSEIQAVMNIFRDSQEQATPIHEIKEDIESTEQQPFNIFIGHGHSPDWKQLRDHLREKHDIRDILEEMLDQSSLAFMVLTGEDETAEQRLRARQNVIHETGLFQGKLGFTKAIVILEQGVEEFSNNAGIQHISFAKGHIDGVFGDVVATIKREMKRKGLVSE
jgi:hypothetical protein